MSDFNTFTGKTVDDAISEACRFFTTERDKLEVEIITGGSTGIFGLVGKKKAQIKARRRHDPAVKAAMCECEEAPKAAAAPAAASAPGAEAPAAPVSAQAAAQASGDDSAEAAPAPQKGREPRGRGGRGQQRKPREAAPARQATEASGEEGAGEEAAAQPREGGEGRRSRSRRPRRDRSRGEQAARQRDEARPEGFEASGRDLSDAALDDDLPEGVDQTPASQELKDLASEIMLRLLTPILEQEPAMEIEGTASRLSVIIQDEEHSGLLIGREGQTLAALQYLANRIMARRWESPVRVQINTGEYREKQDDNLRKMALYLADKAKNLGRPQSTKPLSSYHRRVVHLTLQADETIQTRSKGDGPMKRVIIVPRRPKAENQPQQ
ncbi:RNA-binding cell elongation regulator Jag/EloR [Fundidesulfovibrio agrisoli]|uniref:RNA-binding cell elongation regulator Jag/EloR n=1 Tax=Fundidesulfovibrio agrisoli TaxID=2922717 RepID=UPI001FAD7171|nr:RNA-binding cell elongation regulator Jag/EloR [Fundidesulfovibrio agrisoli]